MVHAEAKVITAARVPIPEMALGRAAELVRRGRADEPGEQVQGMLHAAAAAHQAEEPVLSTRLRSWKAPSLAGCFCTLRYDGSDAGWFGSLEWQCFLLTATRCVQMSGSGSSKYRIIQYALVAMDESGTEFGTLSSLVQNDGPPITAHAYNVHHIDSRMLDSEGAPSQADAFRRLVAFVAEQARHGTTVLVAHNGYSCDFKFLYSTLARLQLQLPANAMHFVDTLRVARAVAWESRPSNFRLGTLYKLATGRELRSAHDAFADTRALAAVFVRHKVLWDARLAHVHSWQAFVQREQVRLAALQQATAVVGDRGYLDDSERDDDDGDEAGDGDEERKVDDVPARGTWRAFGEGQGMNRNPAELFKSSNTPAGVKHCARMKHLGAWASFLELMKPVLDVLVEETNRYALQKRAAARIKEFCAWTVERAKRPFADIPYTPSRPRAWWPVKRHEMKVFIAIILRCAIKSTGPQAMSDDSPILRVAPSVWARSHMSRFRFEQIKRYLHASDSQHQPRRSDPSYDAGYKLRRLFAAAVYSWNKHYDPGPVISIDETLLSFKGRFAHRTTIRTKRHKTGVKLYVASGVRPNYVVAVDVKCAAHPRDAGQFEGTKVVMKLMKKANLLNQHRTVCTDNWYTSTELLGALKEEQTYFYGILRSTRVPDAARFTSEERRQPRGFSKTRYNEALDAMVVGWMDNKELYCLSNATSSRCDHQVRRRVKGVGRVLIQAPDTFKEYNFDMRGIDWVRGSATVALTEC